VPITAADIKLLASERMTDTSDGGGRRTSNVIVDGQAGNIFPKVSRLDSTYGRVNLRKVFGAVQTAGVDTYAGAHAVIMDAPDNDRIHANLFSTGSDFDDRAAARDRIESYVIAGPESRMVLYGRQLVGQMAIAAYQRVEEVLPEVGEVFCLSHEVAGVVQDQQYVRVADVKHEVRTFADGDGEFQRRVVTMELTSPLRVEFPGQDAPMRYANEARPTLIRRTSVADAARYYGIQPVTEPAAAGALRLRVASVYSPIVPTTQRESAVSNAEIMGATHIQQAGLDRLGYMKAGAVISTYFATVTAALPSAVAPGTLRLKVSNETDSFITGYVTDDGLGNIVPEAVPVAGGAMITSGTIDYESGVFTVSTVWNSAPVTGRVWASYTVATAVGQPVHTLDLPVTIETRGTVVVQTLRPVPSKGTLFVDFRALGKWYRLRDDGQGSIAGDDPAYGVGTIDYVSGALVATLGALPDVGSSVLIGWGSTVHYTIRAGAASDANAAIVQRFTLPDIPVKPGTLSASYPTGATVNTAVADAAGVISGGGLTGTVTHATGEVVLSYTNKLPNQDTTTTVSYQQEVPSGATPTVVSSTVVVTDPADIQLGQAVAARGLQLWVPLFLASKNKTINAQCADDGAGNLVTLATVADGLYVEAGAVVGTVVYATGVVSITAPIAVKAATWSNWFWSYEAIGAPAAGAGVYQYAMRTGAAATQAAKVFAADPLTNAPLVVDLTKTVVAAVVPGSIGFKLTGKDYLERLGTVLTDIQPDMTGVEAGTINYAKGEVALTRWNNDTPIGLLVYSCLTKYGDWTAAEASFRTAGSPLRSASGYVQVTAEDGAVLTATSDVDGTLTGPYARGTVNQQMGVVRIEWGEMVIAAGHEAEPWFDPADVVGGMIWQPRAVLPSTIRYNCVVLSNLPLNADILGLEPVRLPSDGRVPIFRPADVAVVHNTKTFALPNPVIAGATYNMGRGDLSELWLIDAAGARVPTTKYVTDLVAGTATMDAALDLTGIPQPLSARHRIEQVLLLSDVQINGEISLTAPLTRAYDADTYVSSALLFGDMFARVANVFDQVTWTNVWQDTRIGANATAEYNAVDYPLEVLNDGAVTERWRINFTASNAFQVIGENLGVIATGTTGVDLQPANALTGKPYFTLRAAGWGAGWAAGNQLRFNTIGATAPIWIARTVLPGATLNGDSLDLQLRGDVDA